MFASRARGIVFFALAFAVAATASRPARAFEIAHTERGAPLLWPSRSIPYEVVFDLGSTEGEILSLAARTAFDRWGSASRGRLIPRYKGPAPRDNLTRESARVERLDMWRFAFGDPVRTVAFTELTYDAETGAIVQTTIHLNGQTFRFEAHNRDAFDPLSVILHEVGHLLGFAHSCGDPGTRYPSCFDVPDDPPGNRDRILKAVMAPTLAAGVERRSLGPDDLAGLERHYAVSSTVTAPRLVRACSSMGALTIEGESFPSLPEVRLRFSSGDEGLRVPSSATPTSLVIEPGAIPPDARAFDVLVRDPDTGAYSALDGVTPESCAPPPNPKSSAPSHGCACVLSIDPAGGRQSPSTLAMLLLVALLSARRRRAVRALFFGIALAASPAPALAYKCSRVAADSGASLVWTDRSITWVADSALTPDLTNHEAALAEVKQSFHSWEEPSCTDLRLPFGGEGTNLKAGYDPSGPNQNVVVFLTHNWTYDPAIVAVTTNAFDKEKGYIVDTDIEVNNVRFHFVIVDSTCVRATGKMDLRNTLTHEVGHFVGLDHPPDEPKYADTVMFARAEACETKKRTLKQDDIDGLCFIYPAGAPFKQCYPPDGVSIKAVGTKDGLGGCACVLASPSAPQSSAAQSSARQSARAPLFSLVVLFGAALLVARRPKVQAPNTIPT